MNNERLMKVLLSGVLSEKSAKAGESNQVVFRVATDATKPEIRRAVELMFDVNVEDVHVLNVKGKSKRFGQMQGKRSAWRKAYVRLQEGDSIDFMPSA
jgi:large subunit ribosomal protein L23